MASLLRLSNELLLLIFTVCPFIQTAVRLSGVSRRLHDIWCNNEEQIITAILEPDIPAFKDTVDLAVTEARCLHPALSSLRPGSLRPPPYLWLRSLLRNAEFASIACTTQKEFLHRLPKDNYRFTFTFTSFSASYYMIRQLVLAYDHPTLQPALRSKLEATSLDTLRTHYELNWSMRECMDEKDQARQGILKDRKDWTIDDELYATVAKAEWDFAFDVLCEVVDRRIEQQGTSTQRLSNLILCSLHWTSSRMCD